MKCIIVIDDLPGGTNVNVLQQSSADEVDNGVNDTPASRLCAFLANATSIYMETLHMTDDQAYRFIQSNAAGKPVIN